MLKRVATICLSLSLSMGTAGASAASPPSPGLARGPLSGLVTLPPLEVPLLLQVGERANCGPTAAAMVLAAYQQLTTPAQARTLRDLMGEWSWGEFPLRRLRLPGHPAGMSTPAMLLQTLNRFATTARFEDFHHPWLPQGLWPALTLGPMVAEGRPVIALVQSSTLWGNQQPGLHWVVVVRVGDETLTFNDPSDSSRVEIPLAQFYQAWQLDPLYRGLPFAGAFRAVVPDRPLPGYEVAGAAQ